MLKPRAVITLLSCCALCACEPLPELLAVEDTDFIPIDGSGIISLNDSDAETDSDTLTCDTDETYSQCDGQEVILFDGCGQELNTESTCDPTSQECTNTSDQAAECVCLSEYALGPDCSTCTANRGPEDGCFSCAPGFAGSDCDECVRYVDVNSWEPLPDGLSWKSAFTDIQSGIDAAAEAIGSGGFAECAVWVAHGTYNIYQDASTDFIALADHVALYGGFEGSESDLLSRDWLQYETVLNGAKIINEQELRVTRILNSGDRGTLDGFTVTGGDGYADLGAVIYILQDTMTIRNCTFRDNKGPLIVHYLQGSMQESEPIVIENCVFSENEGLLIRGGMSNVRIQSNVFMHNVNMDLTQDFACILSGSTDVEPLRIGNNTFYGNSVPSDDSAGIVCAANSDLKIHNNLFWDNAGYEIVRFDPSILNTVENNNVSTSDDFFWTVDESSDPLFVDTDNNDLHLMADSPFIDAGSCEWATEYDIEGFPRVDIPAVPNTGGSDSDYCDPGAFEHQSL